MPSALMQVRVTGLSEMICKRAYGSSIHDSMVCAGFDEGGKDSCQGELEVPWSARTTENSFSRVWFLGEQDVLPWEIWCLLQGPLLEAMDR